MLTSLGYKTYAETYAGAKWNIWVNQCRFSATKVSEDGEAGGRPSPSSLHKSYPRRQTPIVE
ncbi:protein of unknown function [Paraburkholderia kururiensis]